MVVIWEASIRRGMLLVVTSYLPVVPYTNFCYLLGFIRKMDFSFPKKLWCCVGGGDQN